MTPKERIAVLEVTLENLLNYPDEVSEQNARRVLTAKEQREERRPVADESFAMLASLRALIGALVAERDAMRRALAVLVRHFHWSQELQRHATLSLDSEEDRNTLAGYIAAAVARVLRGEP